MEGAELLAERFEVHRRRLHGVAYRMLGSSTEAEDAVQETWLRLGRSDTREIENLGAWLTTVLSRICLDTLRSRAVRREEPSGSTPAVASADERADPQQDVLLADEIGLALLVVLDRLTPAERIAFVLHDVFAVPFDEIGDIVGRTPEAARQLASRARRRVQGTDAAPEVDRVRHRQVVDAFLAAARSGDFEGLVALLDPDVVLRPDDAALRMGSLRASAGATQVAALLSGGASAARVALVDGVAGLAWAPGGRIRGLVTFTVVDGRIAEIDVTGDPERLGLLAIVLVDD
jgi:RNA polymerase sigma-70 factor (ECF subfamily)